MQHGLRAPREEAQFPVASNFRSNEACAAAKHTNDLEMAQMKEGAASKLD